jgi:hypothetical protein
MSATLRGIFLTSEQPEVTARFYREVAGIELQQMGNPPGYVYWKLDHAGIQLAIHEGKPFAPYAHPANHDSNVTHLYFNITSQEEFLRHLQSLNLSPHAIDEVVVTVRDPDGRMVMFGTA